MYLCIYVLYMYNICTHARMQARIHARIVFIYSMNIIEVFFSVNTGLGELKLYIKKEEFFLLWADIEGVCDK